MTENEWLAEKFQEKRPHLRAVAYRILGSNGEADDAVQEAWLRLTRSDAKSTENLGGWLTTVVARVCLDMLRSHKSRKEESLEEQLLEAPGNPRQANPPEEFILADAVGSALLIVLRTLTPAERVAFVLHDLFDLPFEEIAPIVGRSEAAARQLASRARRRVRGGHGGREDEAKKREIVSAFLAASREGNFNALLQLLDPEILLTADDVTVKVTEANKAKVRRPSKARCGARSWWPKPSRAGPWPPSWPSSMAPWEPPGSPVENPGWLSCSPLKMGEFRGLKWSWPRRI